MLYYIIVRWWSKYQPSLLEAGDEVGNNFLQLGVRFVGEFTGFSDLFEYFLLRTADVCEELLLKCRDPRRIDLIEVATDAGVDDGDLLLDSHWNCIIPTTSATIQFC